MHGKVHIIHLNNACQIREASWHCGPTQSPHKHARNGTSQYSPSFSNSVMGSLFAGGSIFEWYIALQIDLKMALASYSGFKANGRTLEPTAAFIGKFFKSPHDNLPAE